MPQNQPIDIGVIASLNGYWSSIVNAHVTADNTTTANLTPVAQVRAGLGHGHDLQRRDPRAARGRHRLGLVRRRARTTDANGHFSIDGLQPFEQPALRHHHRRVQAGLLHRAALDHRVLRRAPDRRFRRRGDRHRQRARQGDEEGGRHAARGSFGRRGLGQCDDHCARRHLQLHERPRRGRAGRGVGRARDRTAALGSR